jgi:Spy/CpxP family protein refolding chaperone
MRRRTTLALAGAVVAVACAIGVTAIASSSSDDGERPITGSDLERATGAALARRAAAG